MATMRSTLRGIAADLFTLRKGRKEKEEVEALVKRLSKELAPTLKEIDPDKNGVIYADDDPSEEGKTAAFWTQNELSEMWDVEKILVYLKKRPVLHSKATSRVFDKQKWEALVASGEISPAIANRYKKKGDTPDPYIRFGKPKADSEDLR